MMPGGMDPKKMKALMKQMGIEQEELRGVIEVIIRTRTKDLVFREPTVTEVRAQGTRTYQVVGKPEERPPGAAPSPGSAGKSRAAEPQPEPSEFPEDDLRLVMDQAGCSREKALSALRASDGSPAEAILSLMG
jgi:nascent polypeptide-associated complex subunit alpha